MRTTLRTLPVLLAALSVAACGGSDDPAEHGAAVSEASDAMSRLVAAYPGSVGFHHELSHWGFAMPTGEKFEWTSDTAANAADCAFVFPAATLVEAGADVAKLKQAGWLYNEATTGEHASPALLIKPFELDSVAAGPASMASDTATAAFERILHRFASAIGFHHEMMHYGLALPGGDKFEWTKDLNANDADMAFVLAADPLVAAGVDVAKLQAAGWLYNAATTGENASAALLIRPIKLN